MIKLGILFFASIYERTGAGKVVRSFKESESIFVNNGVTPTLFSLDADFAPRPCKKDKWILTGVKKLINKMLKQTAYGSFLLIDRLYFGKGVDVINRNWRNILLQDTLIFHEIYTCNAYIDKCKKENVNIKPYLIVLHTSGDGFKMDKIYYPKIGDSKYMKILKERASRCLEYAQKVVFVSQMSAEIFIKLNPKYKEKVEFVYNGISPLDNKNTPTFDGTIRMVTVGTVNARKNQIMQVEMMGELKGKYDLFLTVVGDGDKLESCRDMAKKYGVEDNISFLGGRDDIPQILAQNNVFVMSSLDEGLPIAAIEALRSSLPVILTDVGGDRELIDGNGYLIEPTLDSLCDAIDKLSKSVEKQKEMSDRSYEVFCEKFCTNKMIEGYCNLIKLIKK